MTHHSLTEYVEKQWLLSQLHISASSAPRSEVMIH